MAFILAVVISDLVKCSPAESCVRIKSGEVSRFGFCNCSNILTLAFVPSSSMFLSSS